MTKMNDAKYRYGFTGTLDGSQTHKWVLEGLFGPSYKVTQTKELIDKGHLSKLQIRVLILKHHDQKFDTYEDEIQYIISHPKRNRFIRNLAVDLRGNTLVLFSRVATHGQILFDSINSICKGWYESYFMFTVELKHRNEKKLERSLESEYKCNHCCLVTGLLNWN